MRKYPLLCPESLASVVNMLTDSPEISDLTKRDVFNLYLCQTCEKVGQKCTVGDFCSVLFQLTAEGCSETGPAMHLTNYVFCSQEFRKYLSNEA